MIVRMMKLLVGLTLVRDSTFETELGELRRQSSAGVVSRQSLGSEMEWNRVECIASTIGPRKL